MRSALQNRRRQAWLLLAVVLTAWGLTDVRNRGRVDRADPLAHKTDFTVYTEAGAAFFDGRNPYDVSNPRGWRYLYPPLFAILVAPLAALPPQWQAVAWYFLSLAMAFGCWRESVRLWQLLVAVKNGDGANHAAPVPSWLGFIAVATLAFPILNCLQRGQVGILIAYLLLLGYRLIAENRGWGALFGGAALAAAVAVKLTPMLPVCALLAMLAVATHARHWSESTQRRLRGAAIGVAGGLFLWLIALPSLAVGPQANLRHLDTWLDRIVIHHDMGEENNSGFYSVRNQSLTNAVQRLGNWIAYAFAGGPNDWPSDAAARDSVEPVDQPIVQRALAPAKCALLALLLIGCWKAARRGDALDQAVMFGLASMATLLVSPLSWAHHYLVWLPALLVVPAWLWRRGRAPLAARLALAACLMMTAHYLLLDWTGRAGLLGIGATAWFLIAARIAARGELLNAARTTAPSRLPGAVDKASRRAA